MSDLPTLHVRLLGTFQITYGDKPLATLDAARVQSLLAYLVLNADAPQPRRYISFLLWPASTESQARTNLRKLLLQLRRGLPDTERYLDFDSRSIQWKPESPYTLDVAQLRAYLKRDAADIDRCQTLMELADLYGGMLLPSCYDDWIIPLREQLHQDVVTALDELVVLLEEQQRYEEGIRYAQRLLNLEPLEEKPVRCLMRMQAGSGNRTAALKLYQNCVSLLARELGVGPEPETEALHQALLSASLTTSEAQVPESNPPAPIPEPSSPPPTPPSSALASPSTATPFIGRAEELVQIQARLSDPNCRLLTLLGPGGIGKTRLAGAGARQMRDKFKDGVYFVELASLDRDEGLVGATANAIGLSALLQNVEPARQLHEFLALKEMLLVLDNLEHLSTAPIFVSELLRAAPKLKILATSRQRLDVSFEWILDLDGLDVAGDNSTENAEECSAVRLFVACAQRVNSSFTLTSAELAPVLTICRCVQGMPLALELAAAWIRVLTCSQIAEEIERNLDLLSTSMHDVPERHRSIRAIFSHSWSLLTSEEQDVLKSLSVFRGGFEYTAAQAVASVPLTVLLSLMNKALLRCDENRRYSMHELLRQYAAAYLDAEPTQAHQAHARHSDHYLTFLHERGEALHGERQRSIVSDITVEIENIRHAWMCAVKQNKLETIERVMDDLANLYEICGWLNDGETLFAEAVSTAKECGWGLTLQYRLQVRLGTFLHLLGKYEQANDLLTQALRSSKLPDDDRILCLRILGEVERFLGNYETALAYHEEGVARARTYRSKRRLMRVLIGYGIALGMRGQYAEAQTALDESRLLAEELSDQLGMTKAYNCLGVIAYFREEYATATKHYREALAINLSLGHQVHAAQVYNNLGLVSHKQGKFHEAIELHQEGVQLLRKIGYRMALGLTINDLGNAFVELDEYGPAHDCFNEAMALANQIDAVPLKLTILACHAKLYARTGQPDRAAELANTVLEHPASDQESQNRARKVLDHLKRKLNVSPPRTPSQSDSYQPAVSPHAPRGTYSPS